MNKKSAYDYLIDHGVKPSVQRLAVMDYLLLNPTHPTADEIHSALIQKIPTLSKTTVYNTLKLFVEHGAVKLLTIDEKNVKFDVDISEHAHFLCTKCNKVYDIPLFMDHLLQSTMLPEDFEVESMSLYVRGTCKCCREANK